MDLQCFGEAALRIAFPPSQGYWEQSAVAFNNCDRILAQARQRQKGECQNQVLVWWCFPSCNTTPGDQSLRWSMFRILLLLHCVYAGLALLCGHKNWNLPSQDFVVSHPPTQMCIPGCLEVSHVIERQVSFLFLALELWRVSYATTQCQRNVLLPAHLWPTRHLCHRSWGLEQSLFPCWWPELLFCSCLQIVSYL